MNKKGLTFSKIGMGIKATAVPIKTILMVIIIGVTLFLEIVEIKKHKHETVNITKLDKTKAKENLHRTSSSDNNNNPL